MEGSKGRVCVTGVTGFIGSWIIKRLLDDGYSVNTTIRSQPARAHIFWLEHPNPKGRYNCSSYLVTIERMAEVLSSNYPDFEMPTTHPLKGITGPKFPDLYSEKLIDAGFKYKYGLEEMVEDAIRCCKERGFL